ncbi:hypothetical protein VdG1_03424 [Verticillium dahliae VDG1]|nr:hypothetical protein VdG1_03424 [Verticillium dahliae VDG1]
MSKTVAFLGASSGVGLATLRATLAAGHRANALCRTPANLTAHLPLDAHPNLRIVAGNAHDAAAVAQILRKDATHLRAMEVLLEGSGEDFTVVRCSLFVGAASDATIRVGVEDPVAGTESTAIGYTISRDDAGRWFAENLVKQDGAKFLNKIATITY